MHDLALRRIHDIIKAAAAVHAKSQWTVLILIPEGELHLIAVAIGYRAGFDALKLVGITDLVQQSLDLTFLNF